MDGAIKSGVRVAEEIKKATQKNKKAKD